MSVMMLEREIVHYEVLGRGRPVIFLHGWIGSWRYWIPVMQAASFSYRTYALDLWGFGDSAKKAHLYGIDEQVRLLEGFIEEMGIGRVALVGHGLGALVGLHFARRCPGVVDRILAVSYPLDERQVSSRLKSQPPAALAEGLLSRSAAAEPVLTDAAKTDPAAVQAALNGRLPGGYPVPYLDERTLSLLAHGQNDPLVAVPPYEQVAAMPDMVHGVIFEESGHFPMLDESSKFNRLTADFLSLRSGESPRDLQVKEEWKRRVR